MSCAYECMLLVLHTNMCLCLCVWFVQCLSCRAKSVDLHVVPDGNSTLVLANRLITTFTSKSHMHLTGTHTYTNRCTEVRIQKPNYGSRERHCMFTFTFTFMCMFTLHVHVHFHVHFTFTFMCVFTLRSFSCSCASRVHVACARKAEGGPELGKGARRTYSTGRVYAHTHVDIVMATLKGLQDDFIVALAKKGCTTSQTKLILQEEFNEDLRYNNHARYFLSLNLPQIHCVYMCKAEGEKNGEVSK